MTLFKSGDLVTLKSGGPTMTVDTVNTDIFDDGKITGVLCVWFVGAKLERVRFDHRAIEPARTQESFPEKQESCSEKQEPSPGKEDAPPEEAAGDYTLVLDDMVAAMNIAADADAPKKVVKRPGLPRRSNLKAPPPHLS
jgi:uncharacterized protein YodC (DUF2158 family)